MNANQPNLFSKTLCQGSSFQDSPDLLLCGLLLDLRGRLDKKYLIKLRKPSRTGNHPSLNDNNNDNRHRGYFLQKKFFDRNLTMKSVSKQTFLNDGCFHFCGFISKAKNSAPGPKNFDFCFCHQLRKSRLNKTNKCRS